MEGRGGHQDALFPRWAQNVIVAEFVGVGMALRTTISRSAVTVAALASLALVPLAGWAQYPGQISKKAKDVPELRAVAVLEWTGDLAKPKAARIVPVTIYDGDKLEDAGVYMARPQPLALTGEVEYQLKENGKTIGLFDINNAAQEQGSWVGYGKWKPMPRPKVVAATPAKVDEDVAEDDKPVLHRKHQSGGNTGGGSNGGSASGSGTSSSDGTSAPDEDPDRPKLHKKTDDSSTTTNSGSDSGSAPADDPDRPKLHKQPDSSGNSTSSSGQKPSTAQQTSQVPAQDIGDVSSVDDTDPDRPKLMRGKSTGYGPTITPTLMGLPSDMQQAVAVSDAQNRPDHPWTYSWANPDDEAKMKGLVEDVARQALGLSAPATATNPAPRRTATATARKTAKPASTPAAPAPLADEQFRVFELAYGSGATMVLTAHTDGSAASQKFVTVIAQPDLYGNIRVLFKSVTDMAHLDETPRMRLVDAVDALADNRGELLFELRGDGSRQFALYRVYRGTAEKLFVSGGGVYGTVSSE